MHHQKYQIFDENVCHSNAVVSDFRDGKIPMAAPVFGSFFRYWLFYIWLCIIINTTKLFNFELKNSVSMIFFLVSNSKIEVPDWTRNTFLLFQWGFLKTIFFKEPPYLFFNPDKTHLKNIEPVNKNQTKVNPLTSGVHQKVTWFNKFASESWRFV